MIKVIIFGLFGNRLEIERILDDDAEIIGYSDMGALFEDEENTISTFEYKPFYRIEQLCNIEFNYIIICNKKESVYSEAESLLLRQGIPQKKIIPAFWLKFNESAFQSTFDEYMEQETEYEGAVFGMSYSRRGLITDFMTGNYFKFSLNGMDLHGHELYMENLIRSSQKFRKTEYVLLDIPYYIFNWDVCSSNQIFNRMSIYDEFEDWGHFAERENAEEYIEQYHGMKLLFKNKFESVSSAYSNNYMFPQKFDIQKTNCRANGAWIKSYPETKEENKYRFLRICKMVRSIGAKLIIVVYPFSSAFIKRNRQIIQRNKEEFYSIIEECRKILDFFVLDFLDEPYAKFPDSFFYNPTHMNVYGAMQMTRILDREIQKLIFGNNHINKKAGVSYSVAVFSVAWMPSEEDGAICGSSGSYAGLRGIKIRIRGKMDLHVRYSVCSLGSGWTDSVIDGERSAARNGELINAFRVSVEGRDAEYFGIRYKAFIGSSGWSEWLSDDSVAGDPAKDGRIEAVKMILYKKKKQENAVGKDKE